MTSQTKLIAQALSKLTDEEREALQVGEFADLEQEIASTLARILANLPLNTDSYKQSHWVQYPPNTTNVFSYIASRGGKYKRLPFLCFQVYLKEVLCRRVTMKHVLRAEKICAAHGVPFNKEGWTRIVKVHKGKLPIRVRAVKEGSIIPVHNALVTVEATDPKCFWLPSFLETSMLRAVWYPSTVGAISYHIKLAILRYLEATGTPGDIDFKLQNFGARGVSSMESAMIGDMAHEAFFKGTDTMTGLLGIIDYYNSEMPGFSVPAAEHSTTTTYGRAREVDAYRNMLKQFGRPGSILAVVSDSYDIYNACSNLWGKELKQEVIDCGATVVIRPDSGHPATVVLKCLQLLDEAFGHVVNAKGYKVLNHVRVLQGDGINLESIEEILETITKAGYSADCVGFGMGGALMQQLDRDTQKFAMKCSAALIDGLWVDVYKDPITDHTKSSLKGRVTLLRSKMTGEYHTAAIHDLFPFDSEWEDQMQTVYEDGELLVEYTWDEVRANVAAG